MLSSAISCISYYLKTSCFRPKPLQKHQQPPWRKRCFSLSQHRSYQKSKKKSTKMNVWKSISKKIPEISIFWPFWPPKPFPKPLQNLPKSSPRDLLAASWTLLGPLGNKALKKEAQKCPKRRQGGPKPFPKPSQNPPQTSRKSIKKRMRKIHGFGKRFFQDFLQFWLPKSPIFQWIFDAC